jgi:hypothetical protein
MDLTVTGASSFDVFAMLAVIPLSDLLSLRAPAHPADIAKAAATL